MATHRPKSTLRTKYRQGWWLGEFAKPSDKELPPDLACLIASYRCMAWRLEEEPHRRDVRATLEDLAGMEHREAAEHWRHLAASVRVEIDRAHHKEFRRQFGPVTGYRRGRSYFEKGPENIPELARLAVETMPGNSGGRPRVAAIAMMLSEALATYWRRTTGRQPKAYVSPISQSEFMLWATPLLARAGFKTGDAPAILRAAINPRWRPENRARRKNIAG